MQLTQRAKNVVTNYVQLAVALASAILVSRAVVNGIGTSGYGVWVLLQSLTTLAAMTVGGLSPALLHYMARFLGEGNPRGALMIARDGLRVLRRLVVIAAVAGVLVYVLLLPRLDIPENLATGARRCWLLLLIASVIEVRTLVPRVTLDALQRQDLRNSAQVVVVVFQTILVMAAMRLSLGLESLGLLRAMGMALLWLFWESFARRNFPAADGADGTESLGMWKLLRYSTATSVLYLSEVIAYYIDALVIGVLLGAAPVAFYSPAARLAEAIRAMVYSFVNVVMPRAAELHAEGAHAAFEELMGRGSRICSFVAGPLIAAGMTCGNYLLVAWLGSDFERAHPVLVALLVQVFFLAGTSALEAGLVGAGAAAPLARARAIMAAVNLGLTVWWVQIHGVVGAAAATAVTTAFTSVVLVPAIYRRALGSRVAFVFETFARAGLGLVLIAIVMAWVLSPRLSGAGLVEIVIASAPFVALGYFINAMLVLNASDRRYLASLLSRRAARTNDGV